MTLDSIIRKIEASRKELLDLGLRNPLLNYRKLKSRGVETVDEVPSAVFDILVRQERTMSFLPRPDDDEDCEIGQSATNDDSPGASDSRRTDRRLQTDEPSNVLQARLLKTYYTANTALQEQGVNTLFVALGMVEWCESDSSEVVRRAPLVLVPVEISRSSARGRFNIGYTGEELGANLSFIEKTRVDFRIRVPDLPQEEDLDVEKYLDQVSRCIDGMKRWSVDRESIVLGFFSFSKFLMYKDLDPQGPGWSSGFGPLESKSIRALYGDGFAEGESAIGDEDHLDEHLRPEDVHHVLDADSSQALAILDVNNGRNLVIQGPPGTGKSQTITNIIAEAIGANKKVLFVSEKMAALEVVKRRLDELHLGEACLELHSHKTAKKTVLDELKRTWALDKPSIDGIEDDFAALARVRDGLNGYSDAVNTPVGNTGVTPFHAYGEIVRIRRAAKDYDAPPILEIEGIGSWPRSVFDRKRDVVSNLWDSLKRVGILPNHAFWGCRLRAVLPTDIDSIQRETDGCLRSLEALADANHALGDTLRLDVPEDAADAERLIATGEHVAAAPDIRRVDLGASEWRDRREQIELLRRSGGRWAHLRKEYESVLIPDAWDADVWEIQRALSTTRRTWLKHLSPKYRRAKKQLSKLCRHELPDDLDRQIALVEAITEGRQLRDTFDRLSAVGAAALGGLWDGEHTAWNDVDAVTTWALSLFDKIDEEEVDLNIVPVIADGVDIIGLPGLVERARDALDSHRSCSKRVQATLSLDIGKRFPHPDGLAGLLFEEQQRVLANWASSVDEVHDIALVNNALAAVETENLHSIAELAEDRQGNCSDLMRGEELSAGDEGVLALCMPGAEQGGQGHLAIGAAC